ncbi:MAG TPA: hypothetical protein VIH90_02035 [Candidatus Saccharimonadales bacterium]
MISREFAPMADGSIWQYYHLADGIAVLTSKGRELIHERPETLRELRNYRRKVLGRTATAESGLVRQWFSNGGNSDIYELAAGSGLVVKETTTEQAMYHALNRMDRFKTIIEGGDVPRWIDIPVHYGLLTTSSSEADYMLMQKIDSGVTVRDIIDDSEEPSPQAAEALLSLGLIDGQFRQEVADQFILARSILDTAIINAGHEPRDYMPDWDQANVLVERLETPIAGSHVMLWVIDQ